MKRSILIVLTSLFVFSSCTKSIEGEGSVVTEVRTLTGFTGVDLRCSADIIYKQASEFKVEVSGQQNILNVMITEVVNGNLVVRIKDDKRVKTNETLRVVVSSPVISYINNSGSGDIKSSEKITSTTLKLNISASGDIVLNELEAATLDATISGSGNVNVLAGVVELEKLNISGSGNMELANLRTTIANTTTSGSGYTKIYVVDELVCTISGSGSVYYKGAPSVVKNISGSGNVVPV